MKSQKFFLKWALLCLVSFLTSNVCGSAGIKAVRAYFRVRIDFVEMMMVGNAFSKASGKVTVQEFQETKKELKDTCAKIKRQRSAAFSIQKKIDAAEKLLAKKAAILSSPFPDNDSKKVLENLSKEKKSLNALMPKDKNY